MKNYLLIFSIMTFAIISCNKEKETAIHVQKGVTHQDVASLAKKYNLQDSIAAGYTPIYGSIPSEAFYPEITVEKLDRYFAHWRAFADDINEMQHFIEARKKVNTLDEYYALLEAHPILFKNTVEEAGGMEAFLKEKKRRYKQDNIYLDLNDGSIILVKAKYDNGPQPGRLIHKAQK